MAIKKANASTLGTHISCVPDDFSGSFMHVIHMLYVGIQKHLENTLNAHNQISFSQFVILVGFSHSATPCVTQAKLAEHLTLTEATVSRHITTLVAIGLLSKEKDVYNKKTYNISITPQGATAYKDAKKIIMKELDSLFSHISDTDKAVLIKNFTTTISLLHQKK
jgi:DNA-binding MarR family transcriptional regulator